ncbi:MAG: L-threonylcarbamoyladenylate synthase [Pseudomonadales bacterium]
MLTTNLELAHAAIADGGVVLHATEGVWGLACDPFCEAAVTRILTIKNREASKGLIVIGGTVDTFAHELEALSSAERDQVTAGWPGPFTWVLPGQRFPVWVRGVHAGIAVRVPGHPQARALAALAGPLVSTSANAAGAPAAVTQQDALDRFGDQVDVVLAGAVQNPGVASRLQTLDGAVLRA